MVQTIVPCSAKPYNFTVLFSRLRQLLNSERNDERSVATKVDSSNTAGPTIIPFASLGVTAPSLSLPTNDHSL